MPVYQFPLKQLKQKITWQKLIGLYKIFLKIFNQNKTDNSDPEVLTFLFKDLKSIFLIHCEIHQFLDMQKPMIIILFCTEK